MRSRGDGSAQSTADPSAALARLYRQIESGRHSDAGFGLRDLDRMGVLNKEKTAVRDSYASNVEQFLNRIMVLHVEKQNRIFERAPHISHLSTQRASPSPLRGEKRMMNRFSTGSASGRFAAAPLHPWLQPVAPPGRERGAGRATSSGQGNE